MVKDIWGEDRPKNYKDPLQPLKNVGTGILIFVILIGAVAIIYGLGWDRVDANQIGVKKRLGKVIGTMDPGVKFTGFFTDVIIYGTTLRKVDMSFTGDKAAWDSSKQDVYVDVSVTYTINKENALNLYAMVGEDGNIENLFNVQNIIGESVKQTTPHYSVDTIEIDREAIKDAIKQKIIQNFPTQFLVIDNVIVSNVDLSPEYKAEINAARRAIVTAEKEKELVEVVKFQQQQTTEAKRGELERRTLEADTKYYEAKKVAEGDALKILEKAKAEAEGLNLKKQEITAAMIEYEKALALQKWNGDVPAIVGGGSNMWLNVPGSMSTITPQQLVANSVITGG